MTRSFLTIVLFGCCSFLSTQAAGIGDNFNSRPGIRTSGVKGYLQGRCWFFADFDVNRNGWAPNIEGDGAMVSGTGASPTERTGIYTPMLDMPVSMRVSFAYCFDQAVADRRWLKVFAADASDKPLFLLDSLELTGSGAGHVYTYDKALTLPAAGLYKVVLNYQGIGGTERIAIDQFAVSAPLHYASTCNMAPVALKDRFAGTASHTATGNVLSNDYDPDHETLTAYLLTESPDGQVDLSKDGGFIFTPKEGFTGASTQFSYKVCDNGSPALCSMTTTATIRFPSRSSLTGFQALYSHKAVAINWTTGADNHSTSFEVERSLDGNDFEKVGEVDASAAAGTGQFTFSDKLHEAERKNDLYYRIRQIDAARRVTYSKVLILRSYGSRSVEAVSVTPDPDVNDIQVGVQLKEKCFVVMRVTDSRGAELIRQTAFGVNGENSYNIQGTADLQPGRYQLEVIINSGERLTMTLEKS